MTIADLVADAFRELGVAPLIGDARPEQTALGLRVVNRILDQWNADHGAVYAEQYQTLMLQPGQSVHTIGPTGMWSLTARPIELLSMQLDTGGGTPATANYRPIWPRDKAWYQGRSMPGVAIPYPTYFYYNPTTPNGEIYFDGIPTVAYPVRVQYQKVFREVVLTDDFALPQGYHAALHDTLKEKLVEVPTFSSAAAGEIAAAAVKSRSVVFDRRKDQPRLESNLPGAYAGSFNYVTREWE